MAPRAFLGNLETTAILVRVTQPDSIESQKLYSSSTKPCHVPSVRLEAKIGVEGQTTDGNTAHLYSKDVLAWLLTDMAIPFKSVPHFGKAEAAYHHHRLTSYIST